MQALRPKIIRPSLPLTTKVGHFDHPGPRTLPSQAHQVLAHAHRHGFHRLTPRFDRFHGQRHPNHFIELLFHVN